MQVSLKVQYMEKLIYMTTSFVFIGLHKTQVIVSQAQKMNAMIHAISSHGASKALIPLVFSFAGNGINVLGILGLLV